MIVCDIVKVQSSGHKTTIKVSKNKPCAGWEPTFQCQHGPVECERNMHHACAIYDTDVLKAGLAPQLAACLFEEMGVLVSGDINEATRKVRYMQFENIQKSIFCTLIKILTKAIPSIFHCSARSKLTFLMKIFWRKSIPAPTHRKECRADPDC